MSKQFPKYQWSKFVDGRSEQYVVRTDTYKELVSAKKKVEKDTMDIADDVECPVHKVPMRHYTKGQDEWWAHRTEGGQWCNGRDTKYNREK